MSKVIVLAVKPWEMREERRSGLSVHYIDPTLKQDDGNAIGIQPLKSTLESDEIRKFPTVPGVYDITWKMKPTGKGQVIMTVDSVQFVEEYEFVI